MDLETNGNATLTVQPIELCKVTYRDHFAKFNVNWCVKCSILENGDELILMSLSYSFAIFECTALHERSHTSYLGELIMKPVS